MYKKISKRFNFFLAWFLFLFSINISYWENDKVFYHERVACDQDRFIDVNQCT